MSKLDREHWEAKYAQAATASHSGSALASLEWLPPARSEQWALDLACGRGRHSQALSGLGYRVLATDIAGAALRGFNSPDQAEAGPIFRVQTDLEAWSFADASFDVVVQYDFLDRSLFPSMMRSVKPGGLLLVDTFRISSERADKYGPRNPEYRLASGELEATFKGWEIVESSEREANDQQAARAAILVRRSSQLF